MLKHITLGRLVLGTAIAGILLSIVLPPASTGCFPIVIKIANHSDEPYTVLFFEESTNTVLLSTYLPPNSDSHEHLRYTSENKHISFSEGLVCLVKNMTNSNQEILQYSIQDRFERTFIMKESGLEVYRSGYPIYSGIVIEKQIDNDRVAFIELEHSSDKPSS